MSDQPQLQQQVAAFLQESFTPALVTLNSEDAKPGAPATLQVLMMVGEIRPGLFSHTKVATLTPELAIGLGEALAAEGRRLKSGLEIVGGGHPLARVPA